MSKDITDPVFIHQSPGLTRRERRHPGTVPFKRRISAFGRTNTPFVGQTRDLYPTPKKEQQS